MILLFSNKANECDVKFRRVVCYDANANAVMQTLAEQLDALVAYKGTSIFGSGISQSDADNINTFFNIMFPVGGALVVPLSGYFLETFRHKDDYGFWLVLFLGLTHGVANTLSSVGAQYLAVVLFSLLRSLKWTVFTDFVNKTYHVRFLGRLLGMCNFVVSTLGLLVYPVINVAEPPNTDPSKSWDYFVRVNIFLTFLECLCICFPIYLTRKRLNGIAVGASGASSSPLLVNDERID